MANDPEQSDSPIVPAKPPNKACTPGAAEVVEGRGLTKGNMREQNATRTQCRPMSAPSALVRVRNAARKNRKARFTALLHHVTIDRLRDAYQRLRPKAAAGVDGITWAQYGEQLEDNLRELHARLHQGAYRARPSRRVYLAKSDGRQRPIGIGAIEDKVVQRAVTEVLNAIYETDFAGFSYGFRPGRSQHDALAALAVGIYRKKVSWVLDADIREFFDTIDHGWLVKFVEHRIGDKRIVRLIQKWLGAGILEDRSWRPSEEGVPQGATVSPLLANVFLHYVFDLWVDRWRKLNARGQVIVVRYADDIVIGFERESDARRLQAELRTRLQQFGLELHPEKTRLIEFGRFVAGGRRRRGQPKPETFTMLGFTHVCGKTQRGRFLLLRRTSGKRMREKLHELRAEIMRRRHRPIKEQGSWLGSVVRGYFAYYAVPTNSDGITTYHRQVSRYWYHALRRRSQKHTMTWRRLTKLTCRYLPAPRITLPWPEQHFDRTRGGSRVR